MICLIKKNEKQHCITTGRTYKDWDTFLKKAAPYSVGEEFGRAQNIIFPDLEDWIDVMAPTYAKRFHETHDKVERIEKKLNAILEQNQRILERLDRLENIERINNTEHEDFER